VTFRGPIFSGHPPPPPPPRVLEFLPPNVALNLVYPPRTTPFLYYDFSGHGHPPPPPSPRALEFLPPNVALGLKYPPRTTPFAYYEFPHPPPPPHAAEFLPPVSIALQPPPAPPVVTGLPHNRQFIADVGAMMIR
jgi:hypothetical protein